MKGTVQAQDHQPLKGHIAATACIIVPLISVLLAVAWFVLSETFSLLTALIGIILLCTIDLVFGLMSSAAFAKGATKGTQIATYLGVLLSLLIGCVCGYMIWVLFHWDR